MSRPTVTIASDGKPGHLAQTRGLAAAIQRQTPIDIRELDPHADGLVAPSSNNAPGIVLAAGHKTYHYALKLAGHLSQPAIALMNPGWLKRRKFDLCAIPRHDGIAEAGNVITTEGALNGMTPATGSRPDHALLLIGGPSKHHHWEDASLLAQLHTLMARDEALQWTATGSRRTPHSTDMLLEELAGEHGERFAYTPASQTPVGWVAEQLQRCGCCWVTEDSVSMVYESLTAGARVGLLDVPRRKAKPGRVVRGVESLVERGWVTEYDDWRHGKPLPEDRPALAEADRVAGIIIERWFKLPKDEAPA